jgi:hypothetical protein
VRKSYGGDYDPGIVAVDFRATSLKNGRLLYKKDMSISLQDFMIGFFDKNEMSRKEVQEMVFKATEEKAYPYLDRWVQMAAIRAMGNEGSSGGGFKRILNELIEDKWTSQDMRRAAEQALQQIGRG